MVAAEILRLHPDQKGGIAVRFIAGEEAHAVGNDAAGFGGGSDDPAAGAHAEGIGPTAVRRMADELVGGGAQGRMSGEAPVLGAVHHGPGMLDAHAHGKGLLDHGYPLGKEAVERIPGGMAHTEENGFRKDFPANAMTGDDSAGNPALPKNQLFHPGFKEDLAAEGKDFPAEGGDHGLQSVCAHMGLGVREDFRRGAVGHEGFQHLAEIRGFDTAGELTVREGAGAALAELHVRLRIQNALPFHGGNVLRAAFHGPAAFHQDRSGAGLCQGEGRKKAGRAGSDH